MRKALLFVSVTIFLVACAVLYAPRPAPTSTPVPSPASTTKPTLSPTSSPSTTPDPTETSTSTPSGSLEPTLSLTPTFLFSLPPLTPTVSGQLDCKLEWQSPPRNGAKYKPEQEFTVGWKVMNTGTAVWNPGNVEFTYLGGAKLYDYPVVRLKTSVAPGQSVVLSVDMRAPRNSTKYTTYWSLRKGDTFFCRLTLSIYVP